MDVCEERALAAGRLGKGMLEFFIHLLWRMRAKLEVPVAVLSQEVGAMVGGSKDLDAVMGALRGFKHWEKLEKELSSAAMLTMVVCLRPEEQKFPRDCVAVFVVNQEEGELLSTARGFRVVVFDVLSRDRLRDDLGKRMGRFLKKLFPQVGLEVEVKSLPTAGGVASTECCLASFGAVLGAFAAGAEVAVDLPAAVSSAMFVRRVRRQLCVAFEMFRRMLEEEEVG